MLTQLLIIKIWEGLKGKGLEITHIRAVIVTYFVLVPDICKYAQINFHFYMIEN